jgi:hypothetical protein
LGANQAVSLWALVAIIPQYKQVSRPTPYRT